MTATFERRNDKQRTIFCDCDITVRNRYFDVNENFCERSNVMRKLLVLMIVLAIAGMADAALMLSADGVVDPPDTQVSVLTGSQVVIDVHAMGQGGDYFGGDIFVTGPATLVGAGGTVWGDGAIRDIVQPELQDWIDGLEGLGYLGVTSVVEFQLVDLVDPYEDIPDGKVVDLITLQCLGVGDATVYIMNGDDYSIADSIIIHQIPIPEPVTIALLGLGGLLLRRRK